MKSFKEILRYTGLLLPPLPEARSPESGGLSFWVYAEPSESLAILWEHTNIVPPKSLIDEADRQMGLSGRLVAAAANGYEIQALPPMTPEAFRWHVRQETARADWMHWGCSTELVKYHVVVALTRGGQTWRTRLAREDRGRRLKMTAGIAAFILINAICGAVVIGLMSSGLFMHSLAFVGAMAFSAVVLLVVFLVHRKLRREKEEIEGRVDLAIREIRSGDRRSGLRAAKELLPRLGEAQVRKLLPEMQFAYDTSSDEAGLAGMKQLAKLYGQFFGVRTLSRKPDFERRWLIESIAQAILEETSRLPEP
jgi:hypothetical protein